MFPAVSAAVADILNQAPRAGPSTVLSRDECAAQLALTPLDEYLLLRPMVELTSRPPFTNELEHAQRQQRAERSLAELRARLDPDVAQQAMVTYRQAIQQRPDDWHLHLHFAYLLNNVGDHAAAAAEYRTVLASALAPGCADRFAAVLGCRVAHRGGTGKARQGGIQSATPARPAGHGALSAPAWNWPRSGTDQSHRRVPPGNRHQPEGDAASTIISAAALLRSARSTSISHLYKAVELRPDYGGAHNNLGQALLRRNDLAGAIVHLRRAAELKQCPPRALGNWPGSWQPCRTTVCGTARKPSATRKRHAAKLAASARVARYRPPPKRKRASLKTLRGRRRRQSTLPWPRIGRRSAKRSADTWKSTNGDRRFVRPNERLSEWSLTAR